MAMAKMQTLALKWHVHKPVSDVSDTTCVRPLFFTVYVLASEIETSSFIWFI